MARIARVVIPTIPHHVTQRGVRRMETFFDDEDYETYLRLMRQQCDAAGVAVWAYCLMPNHAHLVVVPERIESLARGIGEAHRRYTRHINVKKGWKGYLWQGRFASFAMDEDYLLAACRYIELNPVRAKLVKHPEDYRWSSARAHLTGEDDVLVKVKPMLDRLGNWGELLASGDQALFDDVRMHERTGRPLGGDDFMIQMSSIVGRDLAKKKPGPKRSEGN
ncbi:MAG: transposase [Mariprofundaceae bacterium]